MSDTLVGVLIGAAVSIITQLIVIARDDRTARISRNYEHRRLALMDFLTAAHSLRDAVEQGEPKSIEQSTQQLLAAYLPVSVFGSLDTVARCAYVCATCRWLHGVPAGEDSERRRAFHAFLAAVNDFGDAVRRDLDVRAEDRPRFQRALSAIRDRATDLRVRRSVIKSARSENGEQ